MRQSYETLDQSLMPTSPSKTPAKPKQSWDILESIIRVFNSSLIFSTLIVPYLFQQIGIIIGILLFLLFFLLSFIQSTLLLDLKYYAKFKFQPPTLNSVFILLKIPEYQIDIFKSITIINANIYVIILLTVFQRSISLLIQGLDSPSKEVYIVLSSEHFILFIGTLILIPFFIIWKYPGYLVAMARFGGIFAILLIVSVGFEEQKTNFADLLVPDTDFIQVAVTIPCLILSFAYHQQFFTGSFQDQIIKNDDSERKLKVGALVGSFIFMLFEILVCVLASYAFNGVNSVFNNNLLLMVYDDPSFNDPNGYKITFYLLISLSALIQIIQYIPIAVNAILSMRTTKEKKEKKKQGSREIMLIDTIKEGSDSFDTQTTPKKLKSKELKQSFISDSGKRMKNNYKYSLIAALIFYLIAFSVAQGLPPILMLLSLMGCTTQNLITFLIPSIVYLSPEFKSEHSPYKWCFAIISIMFSISFFIFGITVGLYALYHGYM
ncbi:hypothetical protein pb186bvf_009709 [Paramecium bursaria]